MKKILVTGGDGRFAMYLVNIKSRYKFILKSKKQLNILSLNSIKKNISKYKPFALLHLAGLSRPMVEHERKISKSIDLNIVGTTNIVKACEQKKTKLVFFSTSYIYPGKKGKYKETDPVLPWNNYGWSKLGAECSVQMYNNSLILRACMTEKPFLHKYAFSNVKSNFIFHEDFAKKLVKILHKKGVYNIGGKSQTIYNFAKKYNKKIKKKSSRNELPKRMDMNLGKLNKEL